MNPRDRRYLVYGIVLFALLTIVGCGSSDRIGITGRVTRKDGTPLVAAKITFRSPRTGATAIGFTDNDGRYELGTATLGEGVPPEGYYVTVHEDRGEVTNPKPRTVHERYTSYSDSGLKFKVEEGGETTYDMVLDPP
jgi:hypothetical protein